MSDYIQSIDFSAKDALPSGNAGKVAKGADLDTEFALITTMSSQKFDNDVSGVGGIATQANAEAGTANDQVMTPLRTEQWGAEFDLNGDGLVADLRLLSGLAAGGDKIIFFDDTDDTLKDLSIGTGLAITGTTIATDDSAIVLANLSGYDANDNVDHTAVSIIAGSGLTGGGTIAANRTLNIGDGNGIVVSADSIAVGAGTGITVNADDIEFDASGLGTRTVGNLNFATDSLVVDDNGVPVRVPFEDMGFKVINLSASATITVASHINKYLRCTHATGMTLTLNSGLANEVGNFIVVEQGGAGQVTIAGTATVNSPDGLLTKEQNSTIVLTYVAADTWTLSGDMTA